MPWEELQEQAVAARLLQSSLAHDRIAHAYLFLGPDSEGKKTASRLLAQALNCEEGYPCGSCSSCHLISSGTHPDVQIIKPEGRFLRLDQIRDLCQKAGSTPLLGRTKVYIVWEADKLLPEAANHLLKILEEPPAATVFVLCAKHRQTLLPTIVSRCQEIWFKPLVPETAARELEATAGCSFEEAHLAAYLAGGDLAAAKNWVDKETLTKCNQFMTLVKELPQGKGALFKAAETFAQAPAEFLPLLQAWYRDLLAWQAGAQENLYYIGHKEVIDQMAACYDTAELIHCNQAIENTCQLVFGRINVNVRLALEALLVQLIAGR
jgi:DNA polymerase-3 subunit delta'